MASVAGSLEEGFGEMMGLGWVDHTDRIALAGKVGGKGQPIDAGRLHDDEDLLWPGSAADEPLVQRGKAFWGLLQGEGLARLLLRLLPRHRHGGSSDIDADEELVLSRMIRRWPGVVLLARRYRGRGRLASVLMIRGQGHLIRCRFGPRQEWQGLL